LIYSLIIFLFEKYLFGNDNYYKNMKHI